MEPYFNHYELDTLDIWHIERELYLQNKSTDEHISKLVSVLEQEIIKTRELQIKENIEITILPFTDINEFDNGNVNQKAYWLKHLHEINNAHTTKEKIQINFFSVIDKGIDSFFTYDFAININKNNGNFDYWFALKLKQYQFGLKHLSDFLDFHLKNSFHNDYMSFKKFLKILSKQYKSEFLQEDVLDITSEWVAEKEALNSNKEKENSSGYFELNERKLAGRSKTFFLKAVNENPNFFSKTPIKIGFHDVLLSLKQHFFISQNTDFEKFQKIFCGKQLKEDQKILWTGSYVELKWFVESIIKSKICIELPGIDKWLITLLCFNYYNKTQGEIIISKYTQIAEARGKVTEKKSVIENIVKEISIICRSTPPE